MELILELTFAALFLYAIFQLASIAGLFSQNAGIVNIGIEGNMIISAALFATLWELMPESISAIPELHLFISIVITIILGVLYMSLLSLFTNRYYANQVVVCTGMNLLAPALAIMLWLSTYGNGSESILTAGKFNYWVIVYGKSTPLNTLALWMAGVAIVIAIVSAYVLNKTSYGLRLKASGENPYSLETAGVSVKRTRREAILISGALSSLAGVVFILSNPTFYFGVAGSGFLAIAIMVMGGFRILGTAFFSIVFAIFLAVFNNWLRISPDSQIGADAMMALPFILPIFGLLIFKKSEGPKAAGNNFKKDQR